MSTPETQSSTASAPLAVDVANAARADLEVWVADRGYDDQSFACTVRSPWLEEFRAGAEEEWTLSGKAGELVEGYMSEFTAPDVDPASRLLSLRGAGAQLWSDAAPGAFKRALAALRDAGKPPETILIVSQERNIPWELMIPESLGDELPLGTSCSIARWFESETMRAPGPMKGDARVAAPTHDYPPDPLVHAPAEAAFVCETLSGERLETATAAGIKAQLEQWDGAVLHFVCHGMSGVTPSLLLDGRAQLTSNQVTGMGRELREAWKESAPVVFLNACEAGRATPALNGAGGMVRAWVQAGAGAVIAPLWSVRDGVAHEIAIEFYRRVAAEPNTPYAEILRGIRAKAYGPDEGEDSYAAYSFFGSPQARATGPISTGALSPLSP